MKQKGLGCNTFVFLFVLAMGVIWLVVTIQGMQLAQESAAWSSTTGTIVDAWIDRETQTDPEGDSETYFKPHIEYSYVVNGRIHLHQRVDFGPQPSYSSSSKAENFLAQYPVGSEVEVFFNPDDYGEAVLVREASGATWGLIGGIAMIVFAVVGQVGVLVKRKRSGLTNPVEDFIPG